MSTDQLRVLVISPTLPYPWWGFGTRVHQLVRHLSRRHAMTVLSYGNANEATSGADICQLNAELVMVPRHPPRRLARRGAQLMSTVSSTPFHGRELRTTAMQAAIDEVLSRGRFDVIQLESSQMCSFRLPTDPAIVLDEHNLEYELLQRMRDGERALLRRAYNHGEQFKFARLERQWWRQVGAVAVTSDREEQIVRHHAPGTPTEVVPNGVDLEYFEPCQTDPQPESVVFTGLLTYRPNLDAAFYLVDEIVPRVRRVCPRAVVTIVGHGDEADLRSLKRPNVVVTGGVPDVRPYLARAQVAVAPLRIGGGTRLKVIEALAMGKPVVSTNVGCEGLEVRNGEHLLIADSPDGFAGALIRLFGDNALVQRLSAAGRARAVERHSWEAAAACLDQLYGRVTARREGASS